MKLIRKSMKSFKKEKSLLKNGENQEEGAQFRLSNGV